MPGLRPLLTVLAAVTVVATACGDSDDRVVAAATRERAPSAPVTSATIVGDELEFDVEELRVPAGQEVTITFENREEQVVHNIHVEAGDVDVKTELEAGPVTQELRFTIAAPGTYTYVCDVHPQTMKGDLVVV